MIGITEDDWDLVMAVNVKVHLFDEQICHPRNRQTGRRRDCQHGIGLGHQGRAQRGFVLRFEGRGGQHDPRHGHRPRSAEHPRQLHLSWRYRHAHASQRGQAARSGGREVHGGSRGASAQPLCPADRDRPVGFVSRQRRGELCHRGDSGGGWRRHGVSSVFHRASLHYFTGSLRTTKAASRWLTRSWTRIPSGSSEIPATTRGRGSTWRGRTG
ncbi:MAG: hypothetical protein MZV64_33525 [Ignavibacteriales bacterium]|nr:hypothetical protein [Ignavibacteriales bacterium]